jgi:hypothetical protein
VVRQAKLKSNMIEIDGAITVPQGVNRFFEASWVHKKGNTYYYSYAAYNSSGKDWPSNIDYAISYSPLGPWTYKGTLNGYAGTGTNHSGIIEFKGKWYFVYATDYLSKGVPWERSVQVNYLYYNEDGTMKKIVQDTTGVESIGPAVFPKDAFYKIRAKHSGKLMDVEGSSTADNANVYQNSDKDSYSQQWKIIEVERGVYQIINRNSGLALDAEVSTDNVLQYTYHGRANQRWKITGAGNGSYYIVNKDNKRMLEVYYAQTDDGAEVRHWTFNGETCQMWDLLRVDSGIVGTNAKLQVYNQALFKKQVVSSIHIANRYAKMTDANKIFDITGRVTQLKPVNRNGCGLYIMKAPKMKTPE